MKIDRRTGYFNLRGATELDNIAYQIYINSFKKVNRRGTARTARASQSDFIRWNKEISLNYDFDFYEHARLVLRNEKINRLKKRILNE